MLHAEMPYVSSYNVSYSDDKRFLLHAEMPYVSGYNVSYSDDKHFGAIVYTVSSNPNEIAQEIMTNGPVEAAFTVYADFPNYKSGI